MEEITMLKNKRVDLSANPPYDPLQAFVRENHIALKGSGRGKLKGLRFAAKDVFKILGSTYGNGHPEWLRTNEPDDFTSSMIEKLLEEGADLVGKTVCDELCFSISGENWNYGSPINPHDPRRYAGGSSSGSGVAVAGGLVDFSLGSDCLGSVRVPASYNGVIGMRPSYKRVPNDGEAPYCESMDVLGYIAKDIDIFQEISQVILGKDKKKVKLKRLIIPKDSIEILGPDIKKLVREVLDDISCYFNQVIEVDISPEGLEEWVEVFRLIQGYEVWESYGGWIRKYRPRLSRGPKERLDWASTIERGQYKKALSKRKDIIARIEDLLADDGLVFMPTAASIAPLRTASLKEIESTRLQSSALLAISPLTNIPQINLPLTKMDGMPFGISFLSPTYSDRALVDLSMKILGDQINE